MHRSSGLGSLEFALHCPFHTSAPYVPHPSCQIKVVQGYIERCMAKYMTQVWSKLRAPTISRRRLESASPPILLNPSLSRMG